jgi:hypothetical protein
VVTTVLPLCVRCGWVRPRNHGRGLCEFCHRVCTGNGTLLDWPRATRTAAEVLEDYAIACARLPNGTVAQRAELIGMTHSALQRALERARARARADAATAEPRPGTDQLEPTTAASKVAA